MARPIDLNKIESIKKVTIQQVVEKGYGGASVSDIAKKAGVSEGYLYNFYKGKEDLVNRLLFEAVGQLMDNLDKLLKEDKLTVRDIVESLIQYLFDLALKEPEKLKFMFVLMHEYKFNLQAAQRKRISKLCQMLKAKGTQTGEIAPDTEEETIYLSAVILPIHYINLKFKKFFNASGLTQSQVKKLLTVCLHSLK